MSGWPDHVVYAFDQMGYHNAPYFEIAIEHFASRWGGLDTEQFVQALQEGTGEDVLLSLWAIGYLETHWSSSLLLPFLTSPHPMEKWIGAICLGKMKEEKALPVLQGMLTEFLPPDVQYTREGNIEWRYDGWRPVVARLLKDFETV